MYYAKTVKDGEVVALMTYNREPQLSEGTVLIEAEEYDQLLSELPQPEETDEISDSEALRIIVGGETA